MVDTVEGEEDVSPITLVSSVSVIPQLLHTHEYMYNRDHTLKGNDTLIKQQTLYLLCIL